MVRKRPASEIELNPSGYHHNNKFLHPNEVISHSSNHSTFPPPPLATSSLARSGLNPGCGFFLPNQSQTVPSVCDFSGLPIFPPAEKRQAHEVQALPNVTRHQAAPAPNSDSATATASTSSIGATNTAEENSSTAWIDGIIKDLIQNSTNVSVPQLIHNVREIIHPCNPNLAILLEYRLRSLISPSFLPEDNTIAINNPVSNYGLILPTTITTTNSTNNSNTTTKASNIPSPMPNNNQAQSPNPVSNSSSQSERGTSPTTSANSILAAKLEMKKLDEIRKQKKRDEDGLHLLTLLLKCAEAVAVDNIEDANKMLLEISELSTPYGTSAQRVAAYFSEAMSARLKNSCLGMYTSIPFSTFPHNQKLVPAFQVFNGISPFVKFSHFTANQAIQEAFERENRMHIIDLDVMQGLQWPGLFHLLASRPGGPPSVRLTGLGNSVEALEATGKRLTDFAEKLGIPFEFIPVADKAGSLNMEKFRHVREREPVAIHWLQHSLYDVTGSDTHTLTLLQRY